MFYRYVCTHCSSAQESNIDSQRHSTRRHTCTLTGTTEVMTAAQCVRTKCGCSMRLCEFGVVGGTVACTVGLVQWAVLTDAGQVEACAIRGGGSTATTNHSCIAQTVQQAHGVLSTGRGLAG